MLVIILPFFLVIGTCGNSITEFRVNYSVTGLVYIAAHVAVYDNAYENSDWQRYGPECTYDVLVNMSLANIVHEKDNFCSMIASELKCRPKGSDTLSCRFTNGKIIRPDPNDDRCSNSKNFVPVTDRFINEEPFEIRFNSKGIENLVVPRNISRRRLDMIRVIVGQLNVGFELENGQDRFVTMEDSSMGYCEVEVKVSRAGYERGVMGREGYDIVFEPERPDTLPLSVASLTIDKVRQPKQCPNRKIYFFGNHEDFSIENKNTFMDMTTSISQMHISREEMYSFTESKGVMRTLNRPRTMRMHQKIGLFLKSINPAQSPLPEIKSPASTNLYAYTNLERVPEYK